MRETENVRRGKPLAVSANLADGDRVPSGGSPCHPTTHVDAASRRVIHPIAWTARHCGSPADPPLGYPSRNQASTGASRVPPCRADGDTSRFKRNPREPRTDKQSVPPDFCGSRHGASIPRLDIADTMSFSCQMETTFHIRRCWEADPHQPQHLTHGNGPP
jgi:hypothetical protein